jgi:hypothetical protein
MSDKTTQRDAQPAAPQPSAELSEETLESVSGGIIGDCTGGGCIPPHKPTFPTSPTFPTDPTFIA